MWEIGTFLWLVLYLILLWKVDAMLLGVIILNIVMKKCLICSSFCLCLLDIERDITNYEKWFDWSCGKRKSGERLCGEIESVREIANEWLWVTDWVRDGDKERVRKWDERELWAKKECEEGKRSWKTNTILRRLQYITRCPCLVLHIYDSPSIYFSLI